MKRDGYSCLANRPVTESTSTPAENDAESKGSLSAKRIKGLYRRNPTLMTCSLIRAVILALLHHFFYNYWKGKKVLSDTQQQWIIRGGTFFAFAFKLSLALGDGIAYVQLLWKSLRKHSFEVQDVDSMFSVLSNPLTLRFLKLWSRVPLLAAIAISVWLARFPRKQSRHCQLMHG